MIEFKYTLSKDGARNFDKFKLVGKKENHDEKYQNAKTTNMANKVKSTINHQNRLY